MTERIKNRKRLANKLQIVAVTTCREIDGKPVKSFQCLSRDAAKCKPDIGKSNQLNNLTCYNSHPNGREKPYNLHSQTPCFEYGIESQNISSDLRNCLITSWGTNKPPPPRKKLFFGFVILNY